VAPAAVGALFDRNAAVRPEKVPDMLLIVPARLSRRRGPTKGTTMRIPMLAALLSLAAHPALAFYDTGDNVAELAPGSLQLAKTANVVLVAERLAISQHKVRVDYVFRNMGDQPVTTLVVFQLPDVEGPYTNFDAGDTGKDNFLGYAASQDGGAVRAVLQQRVYSAGIEMTTRLINAKVGLNPLSEAAKTAVAALPQATIDEWAALGLIVEDASQQTPEGKKVFVPAWTMKSAYYWTATFPPAKDVHIANSHANSVGSSVAFGLSADAPADDPNRVALKDKYCVDDAFAKAAAAMQEGGGEYNASWTSYKLRGGSPLTPAIGKFTLVVEKSDPSSLVSFCGTAIKQTSPTTYETTVGDFTPDRDIDILYLDRAEAP